MTSTLLTRLFSASHKQQR